MSTHNAMDPGRLTFTESVIGYNIYVGDEYVGGIEGRPGHLEYIEMEGHWEGQGVARAAVRKFARLSIGHGYDRLETTNTTSDAMAHILETEGFEPVNDGSRWVRDLDDYPSGGGGGE